MLDPDASYESLLVSNDEDDTDSDDDTTFERDRCMRTGGRNTFALSDYGAAVC
jgi:hypothetical protein